MDHKQQIRWRRQHPKEACEICGKKGRHRNLYTDGFVEIAHQECVDIDIEKNKCKLENEKEEKEIIKLFNKKDRLTLSEIVEKTNIDVMLATEILRKLK